MARMRPPLAPVWVFVDTSDTPDGTPVLAGWPLFELPLPELVLLSSLLSCVPNTPPSTAPMTINRRIGRPIHSHLLRFFLGASYPLGEEAEA